jgi:hypothetical protein
VTKVEGQTERLYSYGMWPQQLYDVLNDEIVGGYEFSKPVPGQVRHPDTEHEGPLEEGESRIYKDYRVSEKQWYKALRRAQELARNPPPYVLAGYNCAAFAREILRTAGQSFPGKGLVFPGVAFTPAVLYGALEKQEQKELRKGASTISTEDHEADITDEVKGETQARAGAATRAIVKPHARALAPPRVSKGKPAILYPKAEGRTRELPFGLKVWKINMLLEIDDRTPVEVIDDAAWRAQWEGLKKVTPITLPDQPERILYVPTDALEEARGRPAPRRGSLAGAT